MEEMKLREKYFNYILKGTKRIEVRLNDEKRKKIKIGDTILFRQHENLDNLFEARVVGLLKYNMFSDLFNDFDISILADKSMTKEELLNELSNFYSLDEQKSTGVIGIVVEL